MDEQKNNHYKADHETRIRKLENFEIRTTERLKTVFERLKDLEKSSRWVSQSFFYLILSGAIGAIFSLLGWLITR